MMVLITYDVGTTTSEGKKRLRHVAKHCVNHGQRVQNSVFECLLDPTQFVTFKNKIENIIDKENDSLRYYYLGSNWKKRVEHIGSKCFFDPEGTIII